YHHPVEREVVLMQDDRWPVSDSQQPPYRWICSLKVFFPEPVFYPLSLVEGMGRSWSDIQSGTTGCGSGTLISPMQVLTSAHVLCGLKMWWDERKGGQLCFQLVPAKKVLVLPARNESTTHRTQAFGSFSAKHIHIPAAFRKAMEVPVRQLTPERVRQALQWDYGLINLAPRLHKAPRWTRQPGWWGAAPDFLIGAEPTEQKGEVCVAGYPGELGAGPCTTLWQSCDQLVELAERDADKALLYYQADTSAGMSGSPVWTQQRDGRYRLLAVHSSFLRLTEKASGRKRTVNTGVRISSRMKRHLKRWGLGRQGII
ncbi:MAG: trypsin-like peptidase domain-containing protein, partial [Bacteroidota bacterium]